MSDINWKENAIATAYGCQFIIAYGNVYDEHGKEFGDGWESGLVDAPYFQLNEIREGDFIPVSVLETEQKYNEVVEVFELFGFKVPRDKNYFSIKGSVVFKVFGDYVIPSVLLTMDCKRQLTYSQIIAIGKLKRMMLEREKSAPKTTPDLTPDNADQVKNPKHYQLIEGVESIEIIARSMTKEQWKGFCLGNMLKYRLRFGKKHSKVAFEDIEKANYYEVLYEMYKGFCCSAKRI